jgi:8-oxo-dGTP pyrophosphatase MutT (NUDIX family)
MLTFHAIGDWPRNQVRISQGPCTQRFPDEVQRLIDQTWMTSDGWLLMGRRNSSVAYYPDRIHPFAGALEPRDAEDVLAAVHRELAEELNFTPADVAEVRCTGIAEDHSIRQPELIFRVTAVRTRDQIERALDRTEHHATWAIPATAEAVDRALADPAELTPVAVAALLLWGRINFRPCLVCTSRCPAGLVSLRVVPIGRSFTRWQRGRQPDRSPGSPPIPIDRRQLRQPLGFRRRADRVARDDPGTILGLRR